VRGVQQAVNEWNGKTKTHTHIHMRMYVCLIKVNTLWLENWFNKHKKTKTGKASANGANAKFCSNNKAHCN